MTAKRSFFTEPGEGRLWTAGFLNERFPEPVSPLGWTIIRPFLENLAVREPLRMLGIDPGPVPVTRLWFGRPYFNAELFAVLYGVFPDWLIPEDAARYFPGGDPGFRRQFSRRPRLLNLTASALTTVSGWNPPVHLADWQQFSARYRAAVGQLSAEAEALEAVPGDDGIRARLRLIREVQAWNEALLRRHRWSLLHAEAWYSLLRRAAVRLSRGEGPARAAAWVRRGDDVTCEFNRVLEAAATAHDPDVAASLRARLVVEFGHRSFSLDIARPTVAEALEDYLAAARSRLDSRGSPSFLVPRPPVWLKPLVGIARRFMGLREAQRHHWQMGLALLRRLYLGIGRRLAPTYLDLPTDVFFLTADELEAYPDLPPPAVFRVRRAEFEALRAGPDFYPEFLQGDRPLRAGAAGAAELKGIGVSPGVGIGRVRVVVRPEGLGQVGPGEVMVSPAADSAWTFVFGRLSALVLERGGQLSHASVVAREYGLPAVAGVREATRLLRDGDRVVVDGTQGLVLKC